MEEHLTTDQRVAGSNPVTDVFSPFQKRRPKEPAQERRKPAMAAEGRISTEERQRGKQDKPIKKKKEKLNRSLSQTRLLSSNACVTRENMTQSSGIPVSFPFFPLQASANSF